MRNSGCAFRSIIVIVIYDGIPTSIITALSTYKSIVKLQDAA